MLCAISFGLLFLFGTVPRAPADSHHQCAQMMHINCDVNYTPEGDETVCGSNLHDYPSLCHFAQQKCQEHHLTILYIGHCFLTTMPTHHTTPASGRTGTSPTTLQSHTHHTTTIGGTSTRHTTLHSHTHHTVDPMYKVFCSERENVHCGHTRNQSIVVCGTDNHLYMNSCEFAKAKCVNTDLQEQNVTLCAAAS